MLTQEERGMKITIRISRRSKPGTVRKQKVDDARKAIEDGSLEQRELTDVGIDELLRDAWKARDLGEAA